MKKFFAFINTSLFYLFFAGQAFAETVKVCPKDEPFQSLCSLTSDKTGSLVGKVIVILLIAAVVIALFFLIWGGIKWILSGGDKAGVEGARNTIVAAIIGLVIALAAFFILQLVLHFFKVDINKLTIPQID